MQMHNNDPVRDTLRDHLSRAGKASAAKLTVEERRERARKGGLARQAKRRAHKARALRAATTTSAETDLARDARPAVKNKTRTPKPG